MEKQTNFLKHSADKKVAIEPIKIFIDGAARGNPGLAGAGIYIKHAAHELIKAGFFLEEKTNNQAEYLALALAIFLLLKKITLKENLIIFSDSELLIKQMREEYQVKNPILSKIKNLIHSMLKDLDCEFKHLTRDQNTIADKLANKGIDSRKKVPETFINFLKQHELNI